MIKKSSIFMIVYVIFLFISVYISNDEYLSKIALGATLAGVFFACSDMFLNPAQYFSSQLNELKKSQLKLRNEIAKYPEEKRGEQYLIWQKKLDSNEDFLNKNLKKTKRMHIAGYIFFALGIFVFLMILAFYNPDFKVFGILLKNERTITILAFAIVVFNYSMQDLLFVKHKKNLETLENISEDENNG